MFKNESNLLPRYQSRGALFAALWRLLLPTDLLFVLGLAIGAAVLGKHFYCKEEGIVLWKSG